jgi:hypothetical protein
MGLFTRKEFPGKTRMDPGRDDDWQAGDSDGGRPAAATSTSWQTRIRPSRAAAGGFPVRPGRAASPGASPARSATDVSGASALGVRMTRIINLKFKLALASDRARRAQPCNLNRGGTWGHCLAFEPESLRLTRTSH